MTRWRGQIQRWTTANVGWHQSFKDWHTRAKLRPRARGPLLLKGLFGRPFDNLKHSNEKMLLKVMNTKEMFGEDEPHDLISSLVKVTFTLRRTNWEGYFEFFS